MRGWLVAALIALVVRPAIATTYIMPSDFGVTCLELGTGKVVWQTPGALERPAIRVADDLVVAEDGKSALVLAATDGKPVKRKAPKGGTGMMAVLPHPLADDHHHTLGFKVGGTDALATADGKTTFQELDWYLEDLAVWGHLAIFSFSDPRLGGELYAWDLAAGRIAWVFRATDHVKDLDLVATTFFALDGDRVVMSTDQHVFLLEAATGAKVWQADLPRQKIRMYDAPWTTFGRQGDLVIARVYEQLFALHAADGTLAWRFDSGMLSDPWPTIVGDRVYVASRTGGAQMASTSRVARTNHKPSAIVVVRDARGGFVIEAHDRRDLPKGATLWGSLHRPPLPPVRSAPIRTMLVLDAYRPIALDLTTVLAKPGSVWIQYDSIALTAKLVVGDKDVASLTMPDSL